MCLVLWLERTSEFQGDLPGCNVQVWRDFFVWGFGSLVLVLFKQYQAKATVERLQMGTACESSVFGKNGMTRKPLSFCRYGWPPAFGANRDA